MEDWALIRRLAAEGVTQRQIARDLGIARATVARAVASQGPPKYERGVGPNAFTPFESRVRALLADYPELPATVIAERVGWTGSITWFRDNVRPLRAHYRRPDPADRLEHVAGDAVQCDLWFPATKIPVRGGDSQIFPVLVMVAAHSRFITALMLPSRTTADLLAGMWKLLCEQLGAVPRRLVWDNEAGIGRGGRLAAGVAQFLGTLATKLTQTRPFDPESKGIVERANQFQETSFLPGRTFTCPDDFNAQLAGWLPRANQRMVRAIGCRPVDLLAADRAAMLTLPPIAPMVGHHWHGRLSRDYYVRIAGNDYSVHPAVIGHLIDVRADLAWVRAFAGGQLVAEHERSWNTGATITDPDHRQAAAILRDQYRQHRDRHPQPRPDGGLPQVHQDTHRDLQRDLADYDRAFGIELAATEVDIAVRDVARDVDGQVA